MLLDGGILAIFQEINSEKLVPEPGKTWLRHTLSKPISPYIDRGGIWGNLCGPCLCFESLRIVVPSEIPQKYHE